VQEVAKAYGCGQHLETCLGSWRTPRYWATTLDEYQKYFERQSTRKTFQKIMVEEPDTESANFAWYQRKYETHQKVK
jgi:ATP-dependent Clp protease ATP-binding subunit ClpA